MSEKDVKDNETEALNNAAAENAENADIEAGETDMATSIESVDFAVVYDDGGDSIATESAEKRGKYGRHRHGRQRCQRQRESRERNARIGRDRRRTVARPARNRTGGLRNQRVIADRPRNQTSSQEGRILLQANPTFALDHVTVHNRKTGRDVLDDVSLAFHAGATHAVLVDAEDVEQHQALVPPWSA